MALKGRVLDLPPEPLALARRLEDRPGVALLWRGFGSGQAFVACDPCETSCGLDPEPGLGLRRGAGPLGTAPRWIGVLPYEGRRNLERTGLGRDRENREAPHLIEPRWHRYPAVAVVSDRVLVVGDNEASIRHLSSLLARRGCRETATLELAEPPEAGELHEARVRAALELIASGELYQVNLARRFRLTARGSPVALLEALSARGFAPYAAALDIGETGVVSTSPELFLSLGTDGRLITSPIKGTRPRGRDAQRDAQLVDELDHDPKERAELVMILDVERNDFGRVARTGSVALLRAPHVCTLPTIHHRLATVGAWLRPEVTRAELLDATLPSGSVTGAPKVRAMEVIAQLEAHRRGLYTGAYGMVCHDGSLTLGMAIRTLTVRQGEAHYHAGGGIVADSDPAREVAETLWKAAQLAPLAPA